MTIRSRPAGAIFIAPATAVSRRTLAQAACVGDNAREPTREATMNRDMLKNTFCWASR